MEEEKSLMSPEQIEEAEAIAERVAQRSGENTRTFTIMPTVTVYNPSRTNPDSTFEIGYLVKGVKTEAGWESEKYEKPFKGLILKVRMFLKLKYKYAEGKPNIITNEFDSYADSEMITVKKQDMERKYQEDFIGNYKEVNDKYSLKSDTETEKKLDLHHAIYILRDLDSKEIIRLDSKGLSRSNVFDYMNSFSRRGLDKMSSTWTIVSSMVSDTDFNGKPRQAPIAAITFAKDKTLSLEELKKLEEIQIEFERQLSERDNMFGNAKVKILDPTDQPAPNEEIPTIQIGDEPELRIEDVPFK